ncbi:uncharacterized protein buc2l [Centropristis striata]|uniref:uncharacterized protein buc2l n=1 Tax=Centropristis striata TaxID=184440 RepID=UPI0027E20905|nr:uncharacterized protein buc2l [Centropristis striata]
MEAATSTFQQSFGLGPRGPNPPYGGSQQAQGPPQPAPGPSGAPRPEEQHHHKPFFYIQPSQPCMPLQSMQWPVPVPMPVSYNPYYGYPGMGYSMPVMPHYQPNPYMEPPGFVLPHTHLHLMDYRRMLNPQYYQTMAYHSRRFRYQHNSQTREMTSSEVQTEPLSAAQQRTSTPGPSNLEAPVGLAVHSSDNPPSQQLSPAVQQGDQSLEVMAPSSTTRTPQNGSFVIQTEEVRIECCTTPVGLQLLHAHETAGVSHRFSQDVVQCSSSVLQGRVLQDEGPRPPADQSEQAIHACPDILLVGTPNNKSEKIPAQEESRSRTEPVTVVSDVPAHVDVQETSAEKDPTSKNFRFKVVHLPFDAKYLDELWKMESTVWSMEETLIPSPEPLIRNDETAAGVVPSVDVLTARDEAQTEDVVPVIEVPPFEEDELEDVVPTMQEVPEDEVLSEDDICPMIGDEAHLKVMTHTEDVSPAPNLLLLDNSPPMADRNQHRVQDHQDTSFESLPAYLPSTSWLADFDNVYCCSKLPPTPKKLVRPPSSQRELEVPTRRRKLDLEYKEQPTVRKPKERYKPKGKVDRRSLSDHECCLNRNFSENAFVPYASKRERLCSRCLAKSGICTSAGPGLDGHTLKRKAAPFQTWNDLPTCEACKSHTINRVVRKGSGSDVRGHDTEGESSENGSCRVGSKWRPAERPRRLNDLKRPLASKQNVEKCPVVVYPKLREKNCACNEPQQQSVARERLRHCPHGNAIREMDENCAMPASLQDKWRIMDQIYLTHRWQTENSWKAMIPNPDSDGSKNGARSPRFNKHKKSQPQSQGTCRKDTRC